MRSMGSNSSGKGIAAIVGVGPGLGRSIARKFAHEGYTVAILARDLGRLSRLAEEIAMEEKGQVYAIRIDCSDSQSIREAFEGVLSLGFVEVLVYNAAMPPPSPATGSCRPATVIDIPVASFQKSLAVSAVGAFHCSQLVLAGMVERGRGTILFTGCSASITANSAFSQLCCGKFALRGLSQCLAREFLPLGVHVAHIILDGHLLSTPTRAASTASSTSSPIRPSLGGDERSTGGESDGISLDPDVVANTYWQLHVQDRSAWTQEIDLRPSPAMPTSTSATATACNFF